MITTIKLSCETCKKKFVRPLSQYNKHNKKNYCSRECFFVKIKRKHEVVCCTCGNLFMPPHTEAVDSIRNYCPKCRTPVKLTCPICKKIFLQHTSRIIKRKTLCCSIECKSISQRKDWADLSRGMLRQRWEKEFGKESLICKRCGHSETYNIVLHHIQYVRNGGVHVPDNLEPLCLNCHGTEHYKNGHDDDELRARAVMAK